MSEVIDLFPEQKCEQFGTVHLCSGVLALARRDDGRLMLGVYDPKQQAGFYKTFETGGELERFVGKLLDFIERL